MYVPIVNWKKYTNIYISSVFWLVSFFSDVLTNNFFTTQS